MNSANPAVTCTAAREKVDNVFYTKKAKCAGTTSYDCKVCGSV